MAAKSTKKTPAKAAAKPRGGARVGRGTRWTDEQVKVLMDAVGGAATAKAGFEQAAKQLGKNVGTVQQKYYNLQKKVGGGARRARRATTAPARASRATGLPGASELRVVTIDELGALAQRVRAEIDRRKQELDAAEQALKVK